MFTDAHCHPYDLAAFFPEAEDERRRLGLICVSSTSSLEEFEYHEHLSLQAKADNAAPMLLCFAVHPAKLHAINNEQLTMNTRELEKSKENLVYDSIEILDTLAAQGKLVAVGETGFDLYNAAFRETEKWQDEMFAAHLETALHYDLPLVIHVRRAMHKIFAYSVELKKCRAVIFHSWPGTVGEGEALLKRGINAFFSFGTTVLLNHREVMRCCSVFTADHLLTETDAPFQPLRGRKYSTYADITNILAAIAALRGEAGKDGSGLEELENIIEINFRNVFGL